MKKILLVPLLSVMLFSFNIPRDKQKHIGVSSLISLTTSSIAEYRGASKLDSWLVGVGACLLIGISKEFYDSKSLNHTEDINDIYADLGGAIIGSTIAIGFSWRF
jgi:uncharacterized protein YfiM (DUF2279 family)